MYPKLTVLQPLYTAVASISLAEVIEVVYAMYSPCPEKNVPLYVWL